MSILKHLIYFFSIEILGDKIKQHNWSNTKLVWAWPCILCQRWIIKGSIDIPFTLRKNKKSIWLNRPHPLIMLHLKISWMIFITDKVGENQRIVYYK